MAARQLYRKLTVRSSSSRAAPSLFPPRSSFDHSQDLRPFTADNGNDSNHSYWRTDDCSVEQSATHKALAYRVNSTDEEDEKRSGVRADGMRNGLPLPQVVALGNCFPHRNGEVSSCFIRSQTGFFGTSSLAWTAAGGRCVSRMPSSALVRFSSTVGERLEDDLGSVAAGIGDVSGAGDGGLMVDGGVIGSLGSSQPVSEVAAVIGDCSYPTAMLQMLIENVHLYAGLPWWAAIVATTLLIRLLTVPVVIFQIKSAARLTLMRPELEKINAEIKDSGYDPRLTADAHQRVKALFKKYNTTPFSPFIGALLQAPIFMCFFFAIKNMAGRIDSFKDGGFLWFTDLSTADTTYILPFLTALSIWITVEVGAADGMEGNPMADKMKTFMRMFAIASFPLTLTFEKALFCYWITSNIWALGQSTILKKRGVKEAFGIPNVSDLVQEQALLEEPVKSVTRPTKVTRRRTPRPSRRR